MLTNRSLTFCTSCLGLMFSLLKSPVAAAKDPIQEAERAGSLLVPGSRR